MRLMELVVGVMEGIVGERSRSEEVSGRRCGVRNILYVSKKKLTIY